MGRFAGLIGIALIVALGLGSPVAWTLGIPWKDCPAIGSLIGTRAVPSEFIACSQLGPLKPTLGFRAMLAGTPANFLSAAIAGILL